MIISSYIVEKGIIYPHEKSFLVEGAIYIRCRVDASFHALRLHIGTCLLSDILEICLPTDI